MQLFTFYIKYTNGYFNMGWFGRIFSYLQGRETYPPSVSLKMECYA